MIYNKICVFDFETDGKNPYECSPVQLSAVMIDPIRLEIIPNSKFNAYLRPFLMNNVGKYGIFIAFFNVVRFPIIGQFVARYQYSKAGCR